MEKNKSKTTLVPPTLKRPHIPSNYFTEFLLNYEKSNYMKKDFVTMGDDALKAWNESREKAELAKLVEITKKPKFRDGTYESIMAKGLDQTVIEEDHATFQKYLEQLKTSEYKDWFPTEKRTVKVTNVSLGASKKDIEKFFSFSGEIEHVDMQSKPEKPEKPQIAYVTFKDSQGAKTAKLLSGATIADMTIRIALEYDYYLPPSATFPTPTEQKAAGGAESTFRKAEDMVRGMLEKGYVLHKGALGKAKLFDKKVAKAAREVGQKTREKVVEAEDDQRRNTNTADGYAQIHESKPPNASDSTEQQHSKPAPQDDKP